MAGTTRAKKDRPKKERFTERLRRQGREGRDLGRMLVNEPRAVPGRLGYLAKRGFRSLWQARGGGFYACGFAVTFVWLELRTLAGEIAAASGVGSFLSEQLIEFIVRFTVQSITNTVQAFLWPLWFLGNYELWGLLGLLAGYLLFRHLLKEPLTRWLFDDDATG